MKTMNTNVRITLTDEERDAIATVLDGKYTKRLATRADITELVTKLIGGLTEDANYKAGKVTAIIGGRDNPDPTLTRAPLSRIKELTRIREGEEAILKGKSESYIIGWNKARSDGL